MFDFHLNIEKEAQLWHFFFFLFFYLLAYIASRKYVLGKYNTDKVPAYATFCFCISLLVLTIAPYTQGDFYHYAEIVQTGVGFAHLEDIYIWLVDVVGRNYFVWRIVVWGTAMLVVYITAKRLDVDVRYTFWVLFFFYINIFSYARASLAFAVYFCGLSFLLKPGKGLICKIISICFGLLLILSSQYFHSSAFALIAVTIVVLIPLNKKLIPIYAIVGLFLANEVINIIVEKLLSSESMTSEVVAEKFSYSQSSSVDTFSGLSAILNYILQYGAYYIPVIIITKSFYKYSKQFDVVSRNLYKIIIGLLFGSAFFLLSEETFLFFYRILYMATIPITLELVYLYTHSFVSRKAFLFCLYWALTNMIYWHVYGIYVRLI